MTVFSGAINCFFTVHNCQDETVLSQDPRYMDMYIMVEQAVFITFSHT